MNIPTDPIFYAFPALLFLLIGQMIYYQRKIAQLKAQIKKEQDRRHTPYLNIVIDRSQLALCLINEGDVIAKNIFIEDVETILDVGFQKNLMFKFSPIEALKPGEAALLQMKIFEKGAPVPLGMLKHMGGVLLNASFTAYVHCKNLEGIPFCIELIKTGPTCELSRIALNEENQ